MTEKENELKEKIAQFYSAHNFGCPTPELEKLCERAKGMSIKLCDECWANYTIEQFKLAGWI